MGGNKLPPTPKMINKNLTKNYLYDNYIIQNKSIKQVANEFKCSPSLVHRYLKRYNIPTRSQACLKVWNKGLTLADNRIKEKCRKQSLSLKRRIQTDPILRERYKNILKDASKFLFRKKNNFEAKVEKELPSDYKYVGDGKFWIEGFNPDFVNTNGCKKIVEAYGDYWHNLPNYKERDVKRLKIYKKYGYKTLIIWQHEMEDLEALRLKVSQFTRA